jgi:hypothetical protein
MPSLTTRYSHWRRVRGDGNCFYRAVGYQYLEKLVILGLTPLQDLHKAYVPIFTISLMEGTGYFDLKCDREYILENLLPLLERLQDARRSSNVVACLQLLLESVKTNSTLDIACFVKSRSYRQL